MKVKVIKDYTSAYPNPIKLKKGDPLISFEEKETQWQGWLWCKNQNHIQGWVPKSYVDIKNETSATLLKDYDATELTVKKDTFLTVILEEGGWLWCVSPSNKRGWITKENISVVSS